jgi:hypothetical protein
LRRLSRKRLKIARSWALNERQAREGTASPGQLSELQKNEKALETIDRALMFIELIQLQSQATGLGLFVEETKPRKDIHGDEWEDSARKEMSELRQAIRKEHYERAKLWELWLKLPVSFLTALTGLIGAAIGLITIMRH